MIIKHKIKLYYLVIRYLKIRKLKYNCNKLQYQQIEIGNKNYFKFNKARLFLRILSPLVNFFNAH